MNNLLKRYDLSYFLNIFNNTNKQNKVQFPFYLNYISDNMNSVYNVPTKSKTTSTASYLNSYKKASRINKT
jgi:hypothetical protein